MPAARRRCIPVYHTSHLFPSALTIAASPLQLHAF